MDKNELLKTIEKALKAEAVKGEVILNENIDPSVPNILIEPNTMDTVIPVHFNTDAGVRKFYTVKIVED